MGFEIVMYSRSYGCPYTRRAKRVLDRYQISYREIHINQVPAAKERVIQWTGFESVPTIIVANAGEDLPHQAPATLASGASPKGVNRGSMITEPSEEQLTEWLRQNVLID